MYRRVSHAMVVSVLLMLAAVAPATVAADENPGADGGDEADAPVVSLDEMTTDDDQTAHDQNDDATLQQGDGDADNPDLVRSIGINALWGGVAGGIVGLGFYLLTGMDTSPWVIAQFAGGGILAGGTIGLLAGLTRTEPEPEAYEPTDSVDYVRQHAPETVDVNILHRSF